MKTTLDRVLTINLPQVLENINSYAERELLEIKDAIRERLNIALTEYELLKLVFNEITSVKDISNVDPEGEKDSKCQQELSQLLDFQVQLIQNLKNLLTGIEHQVLSDVSSKLVSNKI